MCLFKIIQSSELKLYLSFLVLVVDKVVPSRALATLPTSYLYFETISSDEPTQSSKCPNVTCLYFTL